MPCGLINKEYTEKIIKWLAFIYCAINLPANNQETYTVQENYRSLPFCKVNSHVGKQSWQDKNFSLQLFCIGTCTGTCV